MITREEYSKLLDWCKRKRAESLKPHLIERNPFWEQDSLRGIIYIEIDKPLPQANKKSVVYNSASRKLSWFINDAWVELMPLDKLNRGW